MFFLVELQRNLQMEPKHFGPKLQQRLVNTLIKEVEGTCTGRFGFIVTVTKVEQPGLGRIREQSGIATFPIKYHAIVFRPFKGEVLDAVVTQVNKMGFFAEAGPLQVFVSNRLIPSDMTFDAHSVPQCYVSSDQSVKIQKDSEVRLKIVGTRVDATEIFSIGSIKEDYLGLIS